MNPDGLPSRSPDETGVLAGRSDVRRVVVFGSMARGDPSAQRDLYLLILQATEQRFLDRLDQIYRLLVPQVACDILVYTPEEFERLQKESPFVARVVREARMLHAA
jgi:predicted nucleotidyltransferase